MSGLHVTRLRRKPELGPATINHDDPKKDKNAIFLFGPEPAASWNLKHEGP